MFTFDWASLGHARVTRFTEKDTYDKKWVDDAAGMMTMPLLLSGKLSEQSAKTDWLDKWKDTFPNTPEAKSSGKTQAPIVERHELAELTEMMRRQVPNCHCIEGPLPTLKAMVSGPWFFGYTPYYVASGCEPDMLGTVRYVHSGSAKAVMVDAAKFRKTMPETLPAGGADGLKPDATMIDHMLHKFRKLTSEQAAHIKNAGAVIYQCEITSGEMLIVPPGFLISWAASPDAGFCGARRSFLTSSEQSLTVLSAIHKEIKSDQLGGIVDLLFLAKSDKTKAT